MGNPLPKVPPATLLFSRGPRIVNRLEGDELDAEFADLSHQTMQVATGNLGVSAADPGASTSTTTGPMAASGSGTICSRTDPAVPGAAVTTFVPPPGTGASAADGPC
jgi:hypothetical protein